MDTVNVSQTISIKSLKASSSVFPWVARSNSGQETTNPSPEGSIIAVSFFSDIFEMIGTLFIIIPRFSP